MRRVVGAAAALTVAALALAGCAQAVDGTPLAGAPASTSTRPTPSPSSSPTKFPSTTPTTSAPNTPTTSPSGFPSTTAPASPSGPTGALSLAQLKNALLTTGDLGLTGFDSSDVSDSNNGGECPGTPDPDSAVPPSARYGREFSQTGTVKLMSEEIESYDSAAMSHDALTAINNAFGCGKITDQGVTLILNGPTDVSAQLGADEAESWALSGNVRGIDVTGTLVAVHNGSDLVEFEFINLGASVTVVHAGVAKDTAAH